MTSPDKDQVQIIADPNTASVIVKGPIAQAVDGLMATFNIFAATQSLKKHIPLDQVTLSDFLEAKKKSNPQQ